MIVDSEKKNLLFLMASPHPKGTTRQLADAFLEPLRRSGRWQEHTIFLYDQPPHPCTACGLCREQNGCRWHDLDEFDARLRESDLLIIASPIYNLSFPAPMKALLDRCQRYFEARFARGEKPCIQKGRKAVLLLTRGSGDAGATKSPAAAQPELFGDAHRANRCLRVGAYGPRAGRL